VNIPERGYYSKLHSIDSRKKVAVLERVCWILTLIKCYLSVSAMTGLQEEKKQEKPVTKLGK